MRVGLRRCLRYGLSQPHGKMQKNSDECWMKRLFLIAWCILQYWKAEDCSNSPSEFYRHFIFGRTVVSFFERVFLYFLTLQKAQNEAIIVSVSLRMITQSVAVGRPSCSLYSYPMTALHMANQVDSSTKQRSSCARIIVLVAIFVRPPTASFSLVSCRKSRAPVYDIRLARPPCISVSTLAEYICRSDTKFEKEFPKIVE